MEPSEYVFSIDVFTPGTLPMARLAEYMAEYAKLLGHQNNVHFKRIEPGSARLRAEVEPVDVPKVQDRVSALRLGDGPKEALAAKQSIEELLASDNAVATLLEGTAERVVLPFIGRNRPKPMAFPAFREETSIDGVLVNIGGRDLTAHATLQDGDIVHVNISMKRELARELAPLLYGPTIRLFGNGRFERRTDGVWKMTDFKVDRHAKLDDRSIPDVLAVARSIPGNGLMEPNAAREIAGEREDDEGNPE